VCLKSIMPTKSHLRAKTRIKCVTVVIRVRVLDNCVGCGICWTICPKGVLTGKLRGRAYVINESVCSGCYSCQDNCPYSAIVVTPMVVNK